ncbi:CDP-diacylglycerol--glycerol-3-phosphate 3-phosphatidyltransferase ASCRUDRAFT_73700 [Ascoidea rubescens DSM 1968]|uniref:CDP-diacylglycerol--glycerol-3-phosphate 3-phosphatidyltransferase n=1 Tax=Ascoidea rubescens DSM 1968 TaxID=1344418 RepID=A0A1D2VQU2_9ASCO|nr:hypothetical protein ASCRUDRAFT_73700 [Ascoidea rubescens DSM 1968]ODV63972.1 hypothetical protein ASCRUDRAFT_73700 [Ascoidea rubescens DSM 1968]
MDMIAPRFSLNKGDIEIITSPEVFYQQLKEKASHAQERIFLSSLYIGKNQNELVECLRQTMIEKPNLKVSILTDALRGTREAPSKSSASLLARLYKEFGNRIDIRMYHTPNLTGLKKYLIPKRLNEGWGLQHMKLYGFDDEIILSGANLSSDYFTNRQDRYYVFKSKDLTNYYYNIQKAVGSISYKVVYEDSDKQFKLTWPTSNFTSEPHLDTKRFVLESTSLLEPLIRKKTIGDYEEMITDEELNKSETIVYPVSQFTPLLNPDASTEKPIVLRLLSYLDNPNIQWTFTAGYFNMHNDVKRRLLNATSIGNVITASPEANGFYKSKGISKYLPPAYLYLARTFLNEVKEAKKESLVSVMEWKKGVVNTPNGWSYHAKGLWISDPDDTKPCITIIGSSNYTRRAYSLDLESNAVIVTKDENLKQQMQNEVDNIMQNTKKLSIEDFEKDNRHISKGVILATKLLGNKL